MSVNYFHGALTTLFVVFWVSCRIEMVKIADVSEELRILFFMVEVT